MTEQINQILLKGIIAGLLACVPWLASAAEPTEPPECSAAPYKNCTKKCGSSLGGSEVKCGPSFCGTGGTENMGLTSADGETCVWSTKAVGPADKATPVRTHAGSTGKNSPSTKSATTPAKPKAKKLAK